MGVCTTSDALGRTKVSSLLRIERALLVSAMGEIHSHREYSSSEKLLDSGAVQY